MNRQGGRQATGHLCLASSLHGHLTRISLGTGAVLDKLAVERAPAG